MRALNLGLRFLLELSLLVALGYWGFRTGQTLPVRLLLGLGVPLLAAVVWGIFISPKARMPLRPPVRLALELVLFSAGAIALASAGQPGLALTFAALAWVSSTVHFLTGS